MKSTPCLFFLALLLAIVGCAPSPGTTSTSQTENAKPHSVPTALTLDAHATRTADGRIVISGTTNLPDGLKMWIEVQDGHLPLRAPKTVSEDNDVIVKDGQFATQPLWLSIPNTRFTRKGWPKGIEVDDRLKPFPAGKFKIHFESYFNGAWQTPEVLAILGGEDGKKLNGPILKATDNDVIDSPKVVDYVLTLPFPPLSPEAKAINIVRAAILTVPGNGRSAGDIQANVDLFMSWPGIKPRKCWAAQRQSPTIYEVTYDFINGTQGNEQAIWSANIASGEVKYVNENAKMFSWTPNY